MRIAFFRCSLAVALLAACKPQPPPVAPESRVPAPPAASTASDTIDETRLVTFPALPAEAPSPDKNPSTPEKVALGHRLFFAPLSADGQVSCLSCHNLQKYGVDGLKLEKATSSTLPVRNTPTVYNVGMNFTFGWDGRGTSLEDFVKGHLTEQTGLNATEASLPVAMRKSPELVAGFTAAFGKDDLTSANAAAALSSYLRKLVTPSPWDKFRGGDKNAISAAARRGFNVFMSTGCATCHAGANVGGSLVQKRGVVDPWPAPDGPDKGRYNITKLDTDMSFFRSAPLRNVAKTGPYLHEGLIDHLEDLVPMMAKYQLGKKLTPGETADIVAFLNSLTGELPPESLIGPPGVADAKPVLSPAEAPQPPKKPGVPAAPAKKAAHAEKG